MSPLKQKIHKSLSCIFDQLPADGNPGFIVQDKQGSIKINSMLQIDHNASAAKIKSWIHFQGCSKGFEGLAGDQFFAASGVNMDHMGKMFCVYNMSKRNLYIASIYFYIYVFSGIRERTSSIRSEISFSGYGFTR